MSTTEEDIVKLDSKLRGIPFESAFLGGSVLTLLVTDKSADAIRVTKDVDIVMSIRTRKEYHMADSELEFRGFRHATREGAPICRWILDDVTVDVLPIREDVLGWKSKWFEESLAAAEAVQVGSSLVRIVTPPYFVALKLEAFEERGNKDFLTSTDYFKMRRKPEENEFYGKTVNEMRQKYYCPQDGDYWYKDDGYVQCVAYLRDNDWLDGIKFYDRYYVKTDENGIITDVMVVKED